jgi:hypothetical protein
MMRNGQDLNRTSRFAKKYGEGKALQSDAANVRLSLDGVATWGFAHPC